MKVRDFLFGLYTAFQIRELLEDKKVYLIIPAGNIENHGPHLPIGTDAIIAEELAVLLADRLTKKFSQKAKFLVSPAVAIGSVTYFGEKTGLSCGKALKNYLSRIALHALRTGIERVIFLNGCGGNDAILNEVKKTDRRIIYLPRWWHIPETRKIDESFRKFVAGGANPADWIGTHGSEIETSAVLFLEKKYGVRLVDKKEIKNAKGPLSKTQICEMKKSGNFGRAISGGVLGDGSLSCEKKGKQLFNVVVKNYVEYLTPLIGKELR